MCHIPREEVSAVFYQISLFLQKYQEIIMKIDIFLIKKCSAFLILENLKSILDSNKTLALQYGIIIALIPSKYSMSASKRKLPLSIISQQSVKINVLKNGTSILFAQWSPNTFMNFMVALEDNSDAEHLNLVSSKLAAL